MIANHALAHCTANIERHRRRNRLRIFVLNDQAAHLRAIAVRQNNLISFFQDIGDINGGPFNHFKLCLRGCRLSCFLKGIPTKCNHDFVHDGSLLCF